MSSSNPGIEVSEEDKRMHREAEKALKEVRRPFGVPWSLTNLAMQAKSKMASQVKARTSVSTKPCFPSRRFIRCYFWGLGTLENLRF